MQQPLLTVRAANGAAATPHYLATQAALACLMDGGNALDAAITANAVLAVVEPDMCGPGGDLFLLMYVAARDEVVALNGSGRSGEWATVGEMLRRGLSDIPLRGPLAVSVPGAVDAWETALARFGTWGLDRALAPAIRYAEEGFPAGRVLAHACASDAAVLTAHPVCRMRYLPDGRPLRPGERLRQPELAESLRALARDGRDAFYRGALTPRMVAGLREAGGLLTEDDFAIHAPADWCSPLVSSYRGLDILQFPPNTQGLTALLMLNILEGYDLAATGPGSAQGAHLMVEAKHLAFAERDRWIADPTFAPAPLGRLLSPEWAQAARAAIDPERAGPPALPQPEGDTVYLCVADRDGNCVSLIQSLYNSFGSGVMAGDTGIMLHNRGTAFSLDEAHPNALRPRKRPFHTLAPAMALRDERPALVFGTRGANGQTQTQVQILSALLDHGMSLAEALAAPRWLSGAPYKGPERRTLRLEARFDPAVVQALERRGHQIEMGGAWDDLMGHAHGIQVDHRAGHFVAAADPRSDGAAQGW